MYEYLQDGEIAAGAVAARTIGGASEALDVVGSDRVGWFRYFFDDDRWEWSPEVQAMHGYTPGTVTPTTELVLSHKHSDDYRQVADTLDCIRHSRGALSSRHRIRDKAGRVRHVVVVGDELYGDDGRVIGTHGFYIDVTPGHQARQDQMSAAVAQISERRGVIERAKGMLMVVYAVDEAAAFEMLRWRSQETNVKLRALATQIADDFVGQGRDGSLPARSVYDNLLLTAHTRITRAADGDASSRAV
jgi:PAS domain S-box-containing protein